MSEHQFQNQQYNTESAEYLEPMIQRIHELGYVTFQNVIALGRWPTGEMLTAAEKPAALQAMLVYEHRHLPLEARTGFIHKGHCSSSSK